MASCATEIDGKREVGEKDSKNDVSDPTHTPVDQGTQILYNAAVNKIGIRLHPQPTADFLDPLNWSSLQKHGILSIVMFKYFLFTYLTTTTVPSFTEIQDQYLINYSQVNWTVAVPALGLSVGPLIWSSLGDIYGRRVVFIVGTTISLVSTIGAAVADTYSGYMAARFFQGFGVSPASIVGMAVVGGLLGLVSALWINWFNAILFASLLLLELFFMPETLYPRNKMLQQMPRLDGNKALPSDIEKQIAGDNTVTSISPAETLPSEPRRTKNLPFINWRPIPGMRHPKPWDSITRFVLTFQLPAVVIAVVGYSFVWYWWILSVITMVPAAYATYTPLIQGLLFLGLFLGTFLSEIGCSGRLSDFILEKLSKRNGNIRVPEMRLWLAYPAILVTTVAAGIQIGNTLTTSYIVDCYPLQTTSVVTFYAVFLNLSAFINPFFIASWQASSGWTRTFTTQGLIVLAGGGVVFGVLHKFGARMRAKAPEPSWVNPEFDMDP
ncbi:unnamed protein product [Penicillium egyptiacum]|uniref:Major facilitator superfamily (MFS) profile domain-containing protein n=1 Tax=Penicillium egyptiacum TaxID=1303716 RepID=A0A9W4K8Z3_9EURO|nr:unnamed protein product [Penicillium egyptiacum]